MATETNSRVLLKGGTLLIHEQNNHVRPTVSDLLVEGSTMARIGEDIAPGSDTRIIDCKAKIISPGFIDTHRYMYQTQLKGKHANHSLLEYLPLDNFAAALYSTQDILRGQLAGALESIDAGTTTVVDHSISNLTPQHRER
jgi:cytosine/adenosine deaminase-related metal-dependent hydrolase